MFYDRKATVVTGVEFGFTLINQSDRDIYPYLYFFDTTDYSVQVSATHNGDDTD